MNLRTHIPFIAACLCFSVANAQVYTPPVQNNNPPSNGGGSSNTTIVNQNNQPRNNQVVGNDVPFFDPTNNTFSFDGKQFNVQDNQVFRSRFEKYLNAEESSTDSDLAYRAAIRDILDRLSPHNRKDRDRLAAAVARLQHAAVFPQDGRICESLANAVYRVYLAKSTSVQLSQLNRDLDMQRRQLDWNFDQWKDGRKMDQAAGGKGKGQAATDPTNAGHIQRYIQRIGETEASRVANKAKIELSELEAKLEFQALIVQLFMQRRFEHVIIGARLYTEFFKDGAGRLQFEKGSDVEQSFSKTIGFNPTVTTLDSFSNEAIRDVDQAVESFGFLLERNEIDGASRQLQQAFVMGEYLPSVQSVPRESKRKILSYSQNAFQLVNAIEVKNYELAGNLIKEMREQASDFDYSKPTAAVETAKLSSNMKLRSAKNAALRGDHETFEKHLTEATMIWPTNPAIQTEFNTLSDAGDSQQQAKLEFDRLLSTQSYRQIFTNKAQFLAATVDDPERQEALNEIVNNIQEIEITLKQAETLKNAGNGYAAWEIVEKTFRKFPDDVALSAKRSDYATDVAEFVKALKKAQNLEERGQRGSSLAWFLSARRIYPQSENAAEGIKRLVDDILPEDGIGNTNANL
ncbi:MAG: hypothetical protein P1U89_19765 [Verrucomicrobiales bacterium]|nr:hypothetical protein [Verrucomicrobiales bacterium]